MKKENYNQTLKAMLKESGRKKEWLSMKLGYDRMTFWRKVSKNQLTDGQKIKINKLLSK